MLPYSPEAGRVTEKLSKNLGLTVKSPSATPTKRLPDCLSAGLPSSLTLKDKVGPYEVAIVGEEGVGDGEGDLVEVGEVDAAFSSSFLAGETLDLGAGDAFGGFWAVLGSAALLWVFLYWDRK